MSGAERPRTAVEYAAHYLRLGFHLTPIRRGTKAPYWADWANRAIADQAAAAAHWGATPSDGMGVVLGPSGLCSLDLDHVAHAKTALAAVGVGWDRVEAASVVKVRGRPDRGKALFLAPPGAALQTRKLVWPPAAAGDKATTVFELRAGPVQDVLEPSLHPDTGEAYRLDPWPRSRDEIPQLPDFLADLWLRWEHHLPALRGACAWPDPAVREEAVRHYQRSAGDDAAWNEIRRQIRTRLRVADVLPLDLDSSGRACCPFHDEKSPSFWIFGDGHGELWHCAHGSAPVGRPSRSGGSWGDVVDLHAFKTGLTVGAATAELARDLGIALPSGARQAGGNGQERAGSGENELERTLAEFNRRHFKVWFGGASYVGREAVDEDGRETVLFVTSGDLTRYYSHVKVPVPVWNRKQNEWEIELKELAKQWLSWPECRTFERVAFRPQGGCATDTYNLWRGFAVDPVPGSCARYRAHLRDIVCAGDDDLYRYVWRWLAHAVQRPAELPEVALVMRGLQGTGKGWFIRPLAEIFGSHALTVHSMEHVSGRFNAHLKDVILLFADEAFWGGDKSREGLIKSLITEKKRLVEPKNKDAQQVDAFTRLVVATNTDFPVAMDHDDRRICVLDVSDARKQDAEYFGALADELRNGGTAALMHDLLAEDLAEWHPRQKPSRSNGIDIKLRSASAVAQWWHECLVSETNASRVLGNDATASGWWDECPEVESLHDAYRKWCERLNRRYIDSRETWARELRLLVPHLKVYRASDGRRARCYVLGPVAECRARFEQHFRCGAELWADPEPRGEEVYRAEF